MSARGLDAGRSLLRPPCPSSLARRSKRWMLIAGCLVAALAALNQARPFAAPKTGTSAYAGGASEALTSTGRPIVLAARNQLPPLRRDPFAPRVEPSPPPAAPAPQAESASPGPQVPPVPYRFVGKVTYGGKSRVALTAGDRIHLVVEGDVVEGGYVVRKITPDKVTLAYTPLGIDQELALVADASAPAAPVAALVQIAGEATAAPMVNQNGPVARRQ